MMEDEPTAKPAFRTSPQNWSVAGRRGSSYTGVIVELGVFKEVLSDDDIHSIMDNGLEQTALAGADAPLGKLTTIWSQIKAQDELRERRNAIPSYESIWCSLFLRSEKELIMAGHHVWG